MKSFDAQRMTVKSSQSKGGWCQNVCCNTREKIKFCRTFGKVKRSPFEVIFSFIEVF